MNLKCRLGQHKWVKLYSDAHDKRTGLVVYECAKCQENKYEDYYLYTSKDD